jgi:pyruvate dehydrogenase E2 component (dihydrolipoamide acetyltransferase)
MRYGWRAWSFFGAGALFGLLAGAALYAPPELEHQPPPWEHWTWNRGTAAAATGTAGAAPAQPAPSAPEQQSAPAAAAPMAAAAEAAALAPAPVVEAAVSLPPPDPAPQAASFAQPPVKVAKARRAAVARKQAEPSEEHLVDTATVGAGPAPEPARIEPARLEPEAPRAPAEFALPRSEAEPIDISR